MKKKHVGGSNILQVLGHSVAFKRQGLNRGFMKAESEREPQDRRG